MKEFDRNGGILISEERVWELAGRAIRFNQIALGIAVFLMIGAVW